MPRLAPVAQSQIFTKKAEKLRTKYKRIDDSLRGIVWLLSHSPEEGSTLGPPLSPKYRALVMGPPANPLPKIWIAYKLDGGVITLEDIMVLPG
jgi:hypothetical protein